MYRYYKIVFTLSLVFLSSCTSTLGHKKVGAEFELNDDKTAIVTTPVFQVDEYRTVVMKKHYVDMEYLKYKHPVSGEWEGAARLLRGNSTEEVVFFLVITTYDKPKDLSLIAELFKWPLKLNMSKVKSNKHDWFSENFDLANLPDGASAQYWLGYNGGVKPSIQDNIDFSNFKGKGKSVRNATRLWPLKIDVGKYVYMKVIVLEETGHKRLRKIWEKAGGDTDVNAELVFGLVKHGAEQNYIGVATTIGGLVFSNLIENQIDKDGLIDLEYAYESDNQMTSTKIPLIHKRLWRDNASEETSFEFKLIVTKDRNVPIGEKPLSIRDTVNLINN